MLALAGPIQILLLIWIHEPARPKAKASVHRNCTAVVGFLPTMGFADVRLGRDTDIPSVNGLGQGPSPFRGL